MGYEPVGKDCFQNSRSIGKLPQSRPPDSQLPTLPNEGDDSDTAESCFPLRKSRSRSRSRERKTKKVSDRSQSQEFRWSDPDRPYETPKLLSKHQRRDEDKRSMSHQDMSLVEYGYEPIRPVSIKKLGEEEAVLNLDEKLTETDTVLHLSRHKNGNLTTTSSLKETEKGKSLLYNIIDKVKKLSKEESNTILERKDSKEEEKVASRADDKDHLEIQETKKREKKEVERQIKEEKRKQKRVIEKDLKQAQEQERYRLKEEAKVSKRDQEAEQLRLQKLIEEYEKN